MQNKNLKEEFKWLINKWDTDTLWKLNRQYNEQIWSVKIEEKKQFKIIRWWWNAQFNAYYPFALWLLLFLIREWISDLHIEAKNTESFWIKVRLNKVLTLVNY